MVDSRSSPCEDSSSSHQRRKSTPRLSLFRESPTQPSSLIPSDAIDRLDWLASFAYFKGYGNYGDACARAIVDYFAPALANAGWPQLETPEMHSFFTQFLSELRDAAVRGDGLVAAGAHLVCYESPECSFAPQVGELRKEITDAAMDYMQQRYHEVEWPYVPCKAQTAFKPDSL